MEFIFALGNTSEMNAFRQDNVHIDTTPVAVLPRSDIYAVGTVNSNRPRSIVHPMLVVGSGKKGGKVYCGQEKIPLQ